MSDVNLKVRRCSLGWRALSLSYE